MMEKRSINLQLKDYEQKGLYIILKDGTKLILTEETIERKCAEWWSNPDKIPTKVKEAIEFQRCPICPLKEKGDFCDALRTTLPFLDIMEKFVSIDEVTALYRGDKKEVFSISHCTMQEALKYVSILSLMSYCQIGKQYWKYYLGVIPLMNPKDVAVRIYLNMYWYHRGKKEEMDVIIKKFNEQIRITSGNQVRRLSSISKSDVFNNAFVNTHISTEFLDIGMDKALETAFDEFEK